MPNPTDPGPTPEETVIRIVRAVLEECGARTMPKSTLARAAEAVKRALVDKK